MKVVHVITRLIVGGAQENTLFTCEDQHRLFGDDVTLIAGPGVGPEGSLEERARSGGYRVEILPELQRAIVPHRDWLAYRRLSRLLARLRPDIVHTHSSKAGILGRLAAHRHGIPVVHTIHGASFHRGQSLFAFHTYRMLERWAGQFCDRFISVCDAMTAQYVAAGVAPPERFVTIYSGMDVEPFLHPPRPREAVRNAWGLASDDIVVCKVGRLFHLKGHEFLIEAAPQVVREVPNVRFLLIGDGILRDRLENRVHRLGLQQHFVFTGLVPPQRVPELIAASDIAVHASIWEGLARVLPQALIAGKPVVSYDIDGAREVCIPGETGMLIPPGAIDELAAAIIELARDPDLRKRLGDAGRRRFTEPFRHEYMTRRIRDVYQEVLRQRAGG